MKPTKPKPTSTFGHVLLAVFEHECITKAFCGVHAVEENK